MPARFQGEAVQLFSDRVARGTDPFNPGAPDGVGIELGLSDPPHLDVKLQSWGGRVIGFEVSRQAGVLVGEAEGVTYVLSLQSPETPA